MKLNMPTMASLGSRQLARRAHTNLQQTAHTTATTTIVRTFPALIVCVCTCLVECVTHTPGRQISKCLTVACVELRVCVCLCYVVGNSSRLFEVVTILWHTYTKKCIFVYGYMQVCLHVLWKCERIKWIFRVWWAYRYVLCQVPHLCFHEICFCMIV